MDNDDFFGKCVPKYPSGNPVSLDNTSNLIIKTVLLLVVTFNAKIALFSRLNIHAVKLEDPWKSKFHVGRRGSDERGAERK